MSVCQVREGGRARNAVSFHCNPAITSRRNQHSPERVAWRQVLYSTYSDVLVVDGEARCRAHTYGLQRDFSRAPCAKQRRRVDGCRHVDGERKGRGAETAGVETDTP